MNGNDPESDLIEGSLAMGSDIDADHERLGQASANVEPPDQSVSTPAHDQQATTADAAQYIPCYVSDHAQPAQCLFRAGPLASRCKAVKSHDNYFRWIAWSPDATTLLTVNNDRCVRQWDFPSTTDTSASDARFTPTAIVPFAEPIYDVAWYPFQSRLDPISNVYAVSTPHHPIHLIDASTGVSRCTYVPTNHVDEIVGATSLAFNTDGTHLYAGFDGWFATFDVTRPGRDSMVRVSTSATRRSKNGQKGILSSLCTNATYRAVAAASYARTIALYTQGTHECVHILRGLPPATQLAFDPSGHYMLSSHREDGTVHCLDLRMLRTVWTYERGGKTTMRSSVVADWHNVVMAAAGSKGNEVHVTDLATGTARQVVVRHEDLVACCAVRDGWWATCSGQRQFRLAALDEEVRVEEVAADHSFRLWHVPGEYQYFAVPGSEFNETDS
ncbi:hypothetical protein AMAG_13232 [Allomyces macrogynus ATCC 38327]|uniref:Uncharacterized protein n=1 Tax=Allomyces macrogynus (strain ATCC 38327) TaxID=578462 RepID=A0A0L0T0F6_ALLM3|nr:hypothetical protein AMAG_13232 [Allomyces macrogynus ATCC 38327]|eukprot:KNE68059.1 hypothetical protein AMAG_13232 [Allomyces macrogynus ATCC 38327]